MAETNLVLFDFIRFEYINHSKMPNLNENAYISHDEFMFCYISQICIAPTKTWTFWRAVGVQR